MIGREDIGSWLQGPPRNASDNYPGQRLGLPPDGPGSLAPFGRRFVALVFDGVVAQLIATGLFGYQRGVGGLGVFIPLLVVLAMNLLLTPTAAGTMGHRLMGLRVQQCPQGYAGPGRCAVRAVALCLGIPALISDSDGRGLHDRLAGTVIVRR